MTRQVIVLFTILCLLIACHPQNGGKYNPPQELDDGWIVSTPAKEGLGQQQLEKIIRNASIDNPKLDAIVIARNGKLIADQYFNGYTPGKLHKVWSVTKLVTGTALGIAVDKGLLSEKDSIYPYLGDYKADMAPSARAVTIEHLITMTSGFEWVSLGGPESAGFQLPYSNDWIGFTLSRPHIHTPGKIYNYSDGNTALLAPIIKNASGMQAREYAKIHLFKPLAITNYEWDTQSEFWNKTEGGELPGAKRPSGIDYRQPFANLTNTASGLRMRPRDMCKIGQLYLNNGEWNGRQIVSRDWIKASIQPHFGNGEYGYHWRLMTFEDKPCYYATGFGLQRIFVFPTLDLVIVMTQHHYETMPEGHKLVNRLLKELLRTIK